MERNIFLNPEENVAVKCYEVIQQLYHEQPEIINSNNPFNWNLFLSNYSIYLPSLQQLQVTQVEAEDNEQIQVHQPTE